MLMYGDTIKRKANKFKQSLMRSITRKQTCSDLERLQLRSKIPDLAFNYEEFSEPLVALN